MLDVLGVQKMGMGDNFFELGGDSLKAIKLVAKAQSEGLYLTLQSVFNSPTPIQMIESLQKETIGLPLYSQDDFLEFDSILSGNVMRNDLTPLMKPIGNLFLTGATGFLGAHILDAYLGHESGKVYCLVRAANLAAAEHRLKGVLSYYFGNKYENDERIIVVCGDVTESIDFEEDVDMVIHSAASVKHYGSYHYFHAVNVSGSKRVLDIARRQKAKFIHISTLSVSGNSFGDDFNSYISEEELHFNECDLFIGQSLDNVYTRSKFEAEMAVLEAGNKGLDVNIIRVGNLTNRYRDLKFQPNYTENAFVERIKAILDFGLIPNDLLPLYAEFSPIDCTADAIIRIAQYFNTDHTVFHINSNKPVFFDQMLEMFREMKINVDIVDSSTFAEKLRDTGKDKKSAHIIETLINDLDEEGRLNYNSNIRINNDVTIWYLGKLGFEWPEIDFNYIKKYVGYFQDLGYLC